MSKKLVAGLFVLLVACGKASGPPTLTAPPGGALVRFGPHGLGTVAAEVADTGPEWTKGLMGRTHMSPDAGMVFLFPQRVIVPFYMKDTLIPLSIAYLSKSADGTYRVVRVLEMEPCKADPCKLYNSGAPYDAALEANRGWFAGHGIKAGAAATIQLFPKPR